MSGSLDILLTNDDGIDSVGIEAVHDALAKLGDVTVVAPLDDQSKVGRAISTEATIEPHDLGYAIGGTPADCVVTGIEALDLDPDLVVAGCNRGANLGGYVLGRSGTVSAAVEAAFFGIPAIAVSLYVPTGGEEFESVDVPREQYIEAVDAIEYLVANVFEAGVFEQADYLNVNAPVPGDEPAPIRITRPSQHYDMTATNNGDSVTLRDRIWDRMAEGTLDEPGDTDRGAVLDGAVSVSPLTAPHTTEHHDDLDELAASYGSRDRKEH